MNKTPESTNQKTKKQYSVPAITKSVAILDLLADSQEPLALTDIFQPLGIPKATAYMILHVLEENSLVQKSQDDKYQLGHKLYALGMRYMEKMDLQKIAHPHLITLSKQTGFVAHLGRMVDNQVMYIDKVEPSSFIKFDTYIGLRNDIHCCSLGKAMAAYMHEDEVHSILDSTGLTRLTPNTITDRDKFMKVLRRIRETGYAIEDEEGELEVRCIGSTIFGRDGKVAGAVSITALKRDLTPDLYPSVGGFVSECAKAISGSLEYHGGTAISE